MTESASTKHSALPSLTLSIGLSHRLITLTTEELERARRLAVSNTSNKSASGKQRNPFARKRPSKVQQTRKSLVPSSPHRSRSHAEHDQFEELLIDKLAEMQSRCEGRKSDVPAAKKGKPVPTKQTRGKSAAPRKRRQKTAADESFVFQPAPGVASYWTAGHSQGHNARFRMSEPNPRVQPSGKDKRKKRGMDSEGEKSYSHSLNLFNLLQREANSPSSSLNVTKIADEPSKTAPKVISRKVDNEKKLIVTANNSYIHNINISSDAFSCCDARPQELTMTVPEKSAEGTAAVRDRRVRSVALELDKRLLRADSCQDKEKRLDAFKEALLNIITIEPTFGGMLEQIKGGYDAYIEETLRRCDERITQTAAERDRMWAAKLEKVENELRRKSALIQKQEKTIASQKQKLKVPPLDLKRLQKRRESADAANVQNPDSDPSRKKGVTMPENKLNNVQIPTLNFAKLPRDGTGYHDEFLAKEAEFSPSWRDRLAKEKRY